MKILFAARSDAWGGALDLLRKELPDHEFEASGRFGFDSLKGYDVLIPTMSLVDREALASADRLKLVQQIGAGLEGVDTEAAKEKGIYVANVPTDISGNADSVAELAIYLMIGLARNFRSMANSLATRQVGVPKGKALAGKTVGIIGLGGIGSALAIRLKPFGVRLAGIKRSDPEKARIALGLDWAATPGRLRELLGMSDYVALCLPLTNESKGIIGKTELETMKKDAFLINISRGGLVDRAALAYALGAGMIAGAGLDVFWDEPPEPDDPLFQYNVLATPHIGGSTDISTRGIITAVAKNIRRLEKGERLLYLKN